ncbi:hypothetical protein NM208_g3438 [Fusarium decemcellulare]|uniref:Uncharacterized protein n=1 Tax=Fusarium decemcellulare TaxID=57161 RepID=A0ACC1SNZ3_9HYPO|nr:hypothetical protein NM208_g3438 [Fusarium decemcellulare]
MVTLSLLSAQTPDAWVSLDHVTSSPNDSGVSDCQSTPSPTGRKRILGSLGHAGDMPPQLGRLPLPSLGFSFEGQTLLVTMTKQILEDCCFDFAAKWLSKAMRFREWQWATATGLATWGRVLRKYASALPPTTTNQTLQSIETLIDEVHAISAEFVHQLLPTARDASLFLEPAIKLAKALRGDAHLHQLEYLKSRIDRKIYATEARRNTIRRECVAQLTVLQQQSGANKRHVPTLSFNGWGLTMMSSSLGRNRDSHPYHHGCELSGVTTKNMVNKYQEQGNPILEMTGIWDPPKGLDFERAAAGKGQRNRSPDKNGVSLMMAARLPLEVGSGSRGASNDFRSQREPHIVPALDAHQRQGPIRGAQCIGTFLE